MAVGEHYIESAPTPGKTMSDHIQQQPAQDEASPLNEFSQCHTGILLHLDKLADFSELVAAAERSRQTAAALLALFSRGVLEHHAEEETELFPAVLRSALPGEVDRVRQLAERLTREHRVIESLWKRIEGAVGAAAKGKHAEIDEEVVAELVRLYRTHAAFEEEEFLPLSATILGRNGNHMAALGLSLHMRHVPPPVGYI
jgi:hemerythrin-like domain-containing protein